MVMRVLENKFKSKCYVCGVTVQPADGFAVEEIPRVWKTVCKNSGCHSQVKGLTELLNRPNTREITSKGMVNIYPFDWSALPKIKTFPGARFDGNTKSWFISLDPSDRDRVVKVAKDLRLDLPKGFEKVEATSEVKEALARGEAVGAYPYQLKGIEFLAGKKHAFLADDMGLGKTIQSLVALPENAKCIFLCPATLKSNVANEVTKWRPDLTPVVICGRKGFRVPSKGEVVIVNYDILPSCFTPTDKWGEVSSTPSSWVQSLSETVLIADEVHVCKNPKASKSKKTKVLSKMCLRVWAMTGTPIMSKALDMWGVLQAFDLERKVFGSWKNFVQLMNGEKQWVSATASKWVFGTPSPMVTETLRKLMLRRLKKDVLPDLPAKTYQDILVDVNSKSLFNKTEKLMVDVKHLTPNEPLPHFEKFSKLRAALAKDRIPALIEQVESFEEADEPVVVFSAHKEPMKALAQRDGWGTITSDTTLEGRKEIVRQFQDGFLKGVGLTIKAGGVGLTLTRASKMIFVDMEWNPALNTQAEDRICRIGQQADNIQYVRLVSNCALDIHVHNILHAKAEMIHKALESEDSPVVFTPTPAIDLSTKVVQETPEEAQKRIEDLREAKKRAGKKLAQASATAKITARRSSWTRGSLLPDPSPTQRQEIYAALVLMLGSCDGAVSHDNVGFNKPDAYNMRSIRISGLLGGDIGLQKYVWGTLRKYSRQLESIFPDLF